VTDSSTPAENQSHLWVKDVEEFFLERTGFVVHVCIIVLGQMLKNLLLMLMKPVGNGMRNFFLAWVVSFEELL
jgi:hypothetical protein